ncbi:MAG: glycosyltransferase family 39 protein, partial [bacterium]|nr:glycosyltransferase family 39 protein [bacterium]
YLAQSIVKNFHLIWIGVGSTADFYLGPLWTYLTAGLLWLSKGTPLITGYFSVALGVITTLAVFLVGKKVFGKRAGLVSMLLYACLPLVVYFDQKYWNVSLVPLLSLMMFYALTQAVSNRKWLVVFAFLFGLVFHTHLSLGFFGLVALIWIWISKIKLNKKIILGVLVAFLIIYSPLLVFDYYHRWSNLSTPLRLLNGTGRTGTAVGAGSKLYTIGNSLSRLFYLAPYQNSADETNWGCTYSQTKTPISINLFVGGLLLLFMFSKKTWSGKSTKLLALTILTYLLTFLIFPGGAYEYYLTGLFPLFLFIPGILMERSSNVFRKWLLVIVVIICILGIKTVLTAKADYGLEVKKELVREVFNIIGNEPFELKSEGMCHIAEGWRYLFSLYATKPEISDTDRMFGWLYPDEITDKEVSYQVIMQETRVSLPLQLTKSGFTVNIIKIPVK